MTEAADKSDEEHDEMLLKRYHLKNAEQKTPFGSLYYNALYGDDPESAVGAIHSIASHACWLLGTIKAQKPELIEELAKKSIKWPILIQAVNMGNITKEMPPEVQEALALPIAEKFPFKIKGRNRTRGPQKDVFFDFLIETILKFESCREFANQDKPDGQSRCLTELIEKSDPTGLVRDLPELSKQSQKRWVDAIVEVSRKCGLKDEIKEFLREDARIHMQDRKCNGER